MNFEILKNENLQFLDSEISKFINLKTYPCLKKDLMAARSEQKGNSPTLVFLKLDKKKRALARTLPF